MKKLISFVATLLIIAVMLPVNFVRAAVNDNSAQVAVNDSSAQAVNGNFGDCFNFGKREV